MLWYNSAKSWLSSTSGNCSSRYSIHWSRRSCTVLLIIVISTFMLLKMSFWHFTVLRYVLYRDLCIEIRMVSWGTCIITSPDNIWNTFEGILQKNSWYSSYQCIWKLEWNNSLWLCDTIRGHWFWSTYWSRWWLYALWYQATTWTNDKLMAIRPLPQISMKS